MKKALKLGFVIGLSAFFGFTVAMLTQGATLTKPYTFVAGSSASASEVNAVFDTLYNWANGNVESDNVKDNTLTADDIAAGAVASSEILDDSVSEADMNSGAITIANDALDTECVTSSKLATNSVTGSHVVDGSLNGDDIQDDGVDEDDLAAGCITIANDALDTGCVTASKIPTDTITSSHVVDGSLGAADFEASALVQEGAYHDLFIDYGIGASDKITVTCEMMILRNPDTGNLVKCEDINLTIDPTSGAAGLLGQSDSYGVLGAAAPNGVAYYLSLIHI